ncbi:immunity protein Tsi6 family protein [Capnocytophaga cynodegmi]|uniref:immunity protein Tsi6 family protein n=1 Tax=Capnocytophaga cynodegmi TaxID=28189 RepID=UPI0038593FFE
MYIPLERNLKKSYFKELLERAIELTQKEIEATPSLSVYKSILNQLNDIKQSVVEEHIVFSEEEAQQRYSLGQIAIRYFDGYEEFEYADILIDIAYGVPLYPNMLEQ